MQMCYELIFITVGNSDNWLIIIDTEAETWEVSTLPECKSRQLANVMKEKAFKGEFLFLKDSIPWTKIKNVLCKKDIVLFFLHTKNLKF